jgi:hypothetical protein
MSHNAEQIGPPMSSELSSWSVEKVLYVFYFVIWDLGRLLQASALLWALENKREYNFKDKKFETIYSDSLHLTCTEPVMVMKVWADLYNLQLKVPFKDRKQKATNGILEDCMYLKHIIPTLVKLIRVELAGEYMTYLLFIDGQSRASRKKEREEEKDKWGRILWDPAELDAPGPLLATNPSEKMRMVAMMKARRYREALDIYLRAQIDERIHVFRAKEEQASRAHKNEKAQITPAKQVEHLLHTASVPFLASQKPSTHLSTQRF